MQQIVLGARYIVSTDGTIKLSFPIWLLLIYRLCCCDSCIRL